MIDAILRDLRQPEYIHVLINPLPVYGLAMGLIAWLLWTWRDRFAPGLLFAIYLVLSGLERFLVEFIRRNDEVWIGLTAPQIESLVLMAIGIGWLALAGRRRAVFAPTSPSQAT